MPPKAAGAAHNESSMRAVSKVCQCASTGRNTVVSPGTCDAHVDTPLISDETDGPLLGALPQRPVGSTSKNRDASQLGIWGPALTFMGVGPPCAAACRGDAVQCRGICAGPRSQVGCMIADPGSCARVPPGPWEACWEEHGALEHCVALRPTHLTHEKMQMSFSRPWKPSMVLTSTMRAASSPRAAVNASRSSLTCVDR